MRSYRIFWTCVIGMVHVMLPFSFSCDVPGCFCFEDFLSCHNLTSFPAKFPKDLKDIHFYDITFEKIPTYAFRDLTDLKTFKVYRGSVEVIESSSFNGFQSLQTVYFDNVSIGEIQGRAFGKLRNISITFLLSSIRTVRSYAFENIGKANNLVFANLKIANIESHAFENISDVKSISFRMCNITSMAPRSFHNFDRIGSFGFHTNNVDSLACGNIDSAISAATNQLMVYFFSNTASCNCDLTWVIKNPTMTHVLSYSNKCILPGSKGHVKVSLEDLTLDVLNCTQQDATCPEDESSTATTEVTSQAMYTSSSTIDMVFSTSTTSVSTDSKRDTMTTTAASVAVEPDHIMTSTVISTETTAPSRSVTTGDTPSLTRSEHSSPSNHFSTFISTTQTNSSVTTPPTITKVTTITRSVSRTSAIPYQTTSYIEAQHREASSANLVMWSVLTLTLTLTLNCLLCRAITSVSL
ncbi:mucin-3A-like [Ylistrum balloti]|uniref:mucin-3A-like n=1 Tax=Ylistrum balloti TaxID=509963 RepID=UPI002905948D|nr:mucin-3A-like [Ylistrum balloti]